MGIHDRDYFRREGPRYLDALWPSGIVCKWLIGLNIATFLVQLLTYDPANQQDLGPVTSWLVLDTEKVLNGQIWRLLSYAFLHDPLSIWHILFNMLFLWWFGSEIETLYGPREFLGFYLISAFLGGVAYQGWALAIGEPSLCLGASGAVTAVLVLYAFHFPNNLIYVFMVLPVPIWLFAIFQVAQDAFVFVGGMRTRVAVVVHLAGAAFAFVYYQGGWRLTGFLNNLKSWRRRRGRPNLRLFRPESEIKEPVAVAAPSSGLDEHLEAKMDAVLEKVSRHGMGSLTDNERTILTKASEIYRRKRT